MDRYAEDFMQTLRILPSVTVQNRLLSTTDRNIGIVLSRLPWEDKEYVLRLLSPGKARRVKEETARQERQYFDYRQYVKTICHVTSDLRNPRRQAPLRSYLRPHR